MLPEPFAEVPANKVWALVQGEALGERVVTRQGPVQDDLVKLLCTWRDELLRWTSCSHELLNLLTLEGPTGWDKDEDQSEVTEWAKLREENRNMTLRDILENIRAISTSLRLMVMLWSVWLCAPRREWWQLRQGLPLMSRPRLRENLSTATCV